MDVSHILSLIFLDFKGILEALEQWVIVFPALAAGSRIQNNLSEFLSKVHKYEISENINISMGALRGQGTVFQYHVRKYKAMP